MRVVFKTCNACGREFETLASYLAETTAVCEVSEVGLALRNCACGTTHGMEPETLWPDRAKEFEKLWKSDPKYWLVRKLRAKKKS